VEAEEEEEEDVLEAEDLLKSVRDRRNLAQDPQSTPRNPRRRLRSVSIMAAGMHGDKLMSPRWNSTANAAPKCSRNDLWEKLQEQQELQGAGRSST